MNLSPSCLFPLACLLSQSWKYPGPAHTDLPLRSFPVLGMLDAARDSNITAVRTPVMLDAMRSDIIIQKAATQRPQLQ